MNYLRLFSLLASYGVNSARIKKSSLSSSISCDYLFLRSTYFYCNRIMIHQRWRKHFQIWMCKHCKQYIEFLKLLVAHPKLDVQLLHTYIFASAAHFYNYILWRDQFFQIPNASCMHCWSETSRSCRWFGSRVWTLDVNYCNDFAIISPSLLKYRWGRRANTFILRTKHCCVCDKK